MVESEVATLVCRFIIWPGKGFLIDAHFLLYGNQNGKGCSPDTSSKRHSACCTFEKFLGAKKYSSIYKFSILSGLDQTLVPYN